MSTQEYVTGSAMTKEDYGKMINFPIGNENVEYAKYFQGISYLEALTLKQIPVFNVTFEPGCRNDWHIHHASRAGGQMLICIGGVGYYQEWGQPARRLVPGDIVNIPANVKHWHGAAPNSWFSHLVMEVPGVDSSTEWCGSVDKVDYINACK